MRNELYCPMCGSQMVLRVSRFGQFYGCSGFPICKNKMSLREAEREVERQDDGEVEDWWGER